MPEVFDDANPTFQLFPYQMRINTGITGISETETTTHPKYEIDRYNVLGQKIDKHIGGLQLILYNDGKTEKVYIPK